MRSGFHLPSASPGAFTASVTDPVGDLVSRFARTHGPFTTARRPRAPSVSAPPSSTPPCSGWRPSAGSSPAPSAPAETGAEWCDADVLRQIRRSSLALAQRAAEPVRGRASGHLPARLAGVSAPVGRAGGCRRPVPVVEQLGARTAPASEWERSILPARLPGYQPTWLDELTGSGDVVWFGAGALPQRDGWIGFVTADQASLLVPRPADADAPTDVQSAVLDLFGEGVALLTRGVHAALRWSLRGRRRRRVLAPRLVRRSDQRLTRGRTNRTSAAPVTRAVSSRRRPIGLDAALGERRGSAIAPRDGR